MAPIVVLLNRGGGAVAADAGIADKVGEALEAAGVEAEIELIGGGDCAVRCRTVSERGDALLVVGGGDGTIGAAASARVGTETILGTQRIGNGVSHAQLLAAWLVVRQPLRDRAVRS